MSTSTLSGAGATRHAAARVASDASQPAEAPPVIGVAGAVGRILTRRLSTPPERALLVGLSGIDGSGKGFLAAQIVARLRASGARAVALNVDGWLNLPHVRFSSEDPAGNFYQNALRMDEMFDQLVVPLREHRSVRVTANFAEETALSFRNRTYAYDDVDVIILEGIFLFKREYRHHYDLALWIDCGFDTALARAIARGQEGLPPAETVRAYQTIYFPAQRIHFLRDRPFQDVDAIIPNHQGVGPRAAYSDMKQLHKKA